MTNQDLGTQTNGETKQQNKQTDLEEEGLGRQRLVAHQGDEFLSPENDLLGVVIEVVKKTALLGQETSEHGFCCYKVMTVTLNFNRALPA